MSNPFNAEVYWADKERKKWVVVLHGGPRKNRVSDTKYVSARTSRGAVLTAKENSFLTGKVTGYARLAEPGDLGCVEVKS